MKYELKEGYIQVYTGNGKGKTTAALGIVLRAVGCGWPVHIIQYMKDGSSTEFRAIEDIQLITFKTFQVVDDLCLKETREAVTSGRYRVVILDEINFCMSKRLFKVKDMISIIKSKPINVELILTGRNAPKSIINIADLVTEMKEIKHYYTRGIKARYGIEK